jgi:hypothetical protein
MKILFFGKIQGFTQIRLLTLEKKRSYSPDMFLADFLFDALSLEP